MVDADDVIADGGLPIADRWRDNGSLDPERSPES
jgi:hypothetical protein